MWGPEQEINVTAARPDRLTWDETNFQKHIILTLRK